MQTTLSRRQFLAMASLAAAAPFSTAAAVAAPRVATLDWAILETLLAIGANVVAGTELAQFRQVAVEPPVPEDVADLGLRGSPNLEILHYARPDIIFNSNFYASADRQLSRIAPVESHSVYVAGESPFALSEKMTLAVGERLGLAAAAELVANSSSELDMLRRLLELRVGRPVLPINLGDDRHFRVFGADSMFGEVITRLGLENAWRDATSYSAMAPVGIEALAGMPDAWVVLIGPHPADAFETLRSGAFWNRLPAVREGRVLNLAPVNPFGALPAAMRFGRLLAKGLDDALRG